MFWIALGMAFFYTWIPQYFYVALQSFSLICLLTSNRKMNFLASAGSGYGAGFGALTLDLSYIG
jgi:hypothetical protein